MYRNTKASLKDELIEEFPQMLNDELNEPGEPMHIHLQDGARPRKTTVPRQVAKRFEHAANTTLNDLIARGVLVNGAAQQSGSQMETMLGCDFVRTTEN